MRKISTIRVLRWLMPNHIYGLTFILGRSLLRQMKMDSLLRTSRRSVRFSVVRRPARQHHHKLWKRALDSCLCSWCLLRCISIRGRFLSFLNMSQVILAWVWLHRCIASTKRSEGASNKNNINATGQFESRRPENSVSRPAWDHFVVSGEAQEHYDQWIWGSRDAFPLYNL